MMKNIFLLILFHLNFTAISQKVENFNFHILLQNKLKHTVKEIDVEEAVKDTSILFLDAREYNEYKISHLKNSKYIGYKKFTLTDVQNINKNKKIVVYCSVGYRSEKITAILTKRGFTNCYNLYGGIYEWVNQNNLVYDLENKPTKKVHIYSKKWSIWLTKGEKYFD